MDKTSLIGIILAFVALSVGMVLKGVSFSALANPAAILIIIAGQSQQSLLRSQQKKLKKCLRCFECYLRKINSSQ